MTNDERDNAILALEARINEMFAHIDLIVAMVVTTTEDIVANNDAVAEASRLEELDERDEEEVTARELAEWFFT
jgi:hypothetical protein